jgi:hypothetical protein
MPEQVQEQNPDRIAEEKVDSLPQEAFDKFAPNEHRTATWSIAHLKAAQLGTRTAHFVEMATGGQGAHDADSRAQRERERENVGLPPKGLF